LLFFLLVVIYTGLLDTGAEYFYPMNEEYSVTPTSKHYTCMIDLVGRVDRLEKAQDLRRNMPFEPGAAS